MNLSSHEVRWFFGGDIPEGGGERCVAADFFSAYPSRHALQDQSWSDAWRYDDYVIIPGATDMGIKLRDEPRVDGSRKVELQFKGCVDALGVHSFSNAEGQVDRWIKWSYKGDSVGERWRKMLAEPGNDLVRVEKKRLLRKVDLVSGKEVSPNERVERGFQMELTRLRIRGCSFWTFGFEAFPIDEQMKKEFVEMANGFMSDFGQGYELMKTNSQSYPEFLQQFVTKIVEL